MLKCNIKTTAVVREQILNKQQLNYNNRGTVGKCILYSVLAKGLYNEDRSLGAQLSIESQCVKGRLGGWCEITASQEVTQLKNRENCKRVCDEKT
jgi:hypothetical protein